MVVIKEVAALELTVPLHVPMAFATRSVDARDFTLVRIETADGTVGNGVVYMHVKRIIEEKLRPLLLGQEIFDTERLWYAMYREMYRDRKGAAIRAISALDIALWDAKAKFLKLPVFKLLGARKDRIACYGSGGYYRKRGRAGLDELAVEMAGYVRRGLQAVKMKVGAVPLREDIERVHVVRDAIGPEVGLMIDANNAYDAATALRAGKAFEKYGILWFEEPVWPDDLSGSAKVARKLSAPVASGELEYTRYGFRDLIGSSAVDILQPDAEVVGGVSEWLKVAALAGAYNMPVAPHWAQEIHVHLASAVDNSTWIEWFDRDRDIRKEDELYETNVNLVDGYATPSKEPGFGIKLDEEAIARFTVA